MALYFIRHGESVSNERNLFAGRVDTPLTSLGRRQAHQAARIVKQKNLRFDEIHVSPLSRAFDTAKLLAKNSGHENIPMVVTDTLVERDFGKLSEQNKGLIKKYYGAEQFEHMFHAHDGAAPGGESFVAMYDRVKAYYDTVLRPLSEEGKVVLVVAHKYIVEMFALIAADLKPEDYHDFKIPNSKPCSFEDLARTTKTTMTRVNAFAEEIESRLAPLVFMACMTGVAAKFLLGRSLPDGVFSLLCLILLALSSGIALLRLERQIVLSAPTSLKQLWKGLAIRGGVAVSLLMVPHPLVRAAALFLLLPSAMTAPTFSFVWGGDYFLSMQGTLVLSALAPMVLAIVKWMSPATAIDMFGFWIVFLTTVLVPAVIAQVWRRARPIQAGQIATNWGWVSGAVMIPLAALAGFQYAPKAGELFQASMIPAFVTTLILFAGLRVFAMIAMKLSAKSAKSSAGHARLTKDIYINHVVPNIFFWFALLHGNSLAAPLKFAATVVFFLSIYLEEIRFVRQFPVLAGLETRERRERLMAQAIPADLPQN